MIDIDNVATRAPDNPTDDAAADDAITSDAAATAKDDETEDQE